MVIDKDVLLIIVWLLYAIYMVARIYKFVKEARAIKTRKQVIEKACEWLCENIDDYARIGEDGAWVEHSVVRDFKKAMEEI